MPKGDRHVTFSLEDVLVGESLPGNIYVFIQNRFILLRPKDDVMDRATFERLDQKKAHTLFVLENDRSAFQTWSERKLQMENETRATLPETLAIQKAKAEVRAGLLHLFQDKTESSLSRSYQDSKRLVVEVMKMPFALKSLTEIQNYSRSTADHSVNVSVLSIYLAQQMGYSHKGILQNIAAGALLHDIGKAFVQTSDNDAPDVIEQLMSEHPSIGIDYLAKNPEISNEIKMIVAQHHEFHDGSGYPLMLRGNQIYELARIVSICNAFDELVSNSKGTLKERQSNAIHQLDRVMFRKFDQAKLFKAIKIFQAGV